MKISLSDPVATAASALMSLASAVASCISSSYGVLTASSLKGSCLASESDQNHWINFLLEAGMMYERDFISHSHNVLLIRVYSVGETRYMHV